MPLRSAGSRDPVEPAVAGSYFVAAYPPFSTWQPSQVEAARSLLDLPGAPRALGLYVHVPFCQKKCDYCYYLSFAGKPPADVDAYLDTVLAEIGLYAGLAAVEGREVSFAYFGGGTPSILTPDQIRLLGLGLKERLPWRGVREVTFECAPRTVRREKLEALLEIGVTRVSLGIQSFDDGILRENGRVHLAADAERAFGLLRDAGFAWINVDLMAGLPGESWSQWELSIRRVLELDPDSVTLYQTEMPQNTRMFREFTGGRLAAPPLSWAEKRERIEHGFAELERAGYVVASGYAAVKDPRRRPFVYQEELWTGADMLGLGVASFSYVGGAHYQNAATLEEHANIVRAGRLPIGRARLLTREERFVRELVLGLKRGHICRAYFLEKFGEDPVERFSAELGRMEAAGWLAVSSDAVTLTRAGLVRVDALLPRFYLSEHQNIRYT